MTTQLQRLARPFPAKYVRKPPAGKWGDYVPHHVVTQALLAIVGPFDLSVGEVFHGEDGKIEGCLITLSVVIDGTPVVVTEVGDCEQPTNWKTQGARMKDAISDGVKRCAARLGLGLHLWAGADYFLYDQLRHDSQSELDEIAPPAFRSRRQMISARILALGAAGGSVAEKRVEWNLPPVEDCDEKQLDLFEEMLTEIEAALEAPM